MAAGNQFVVSLTSRKRFKIWGGGIDWPVLNPASGLPNIGENEECTSLAVSNCHVAVILENKQTGRTRVRQWGMNTCGNINGKPNDDPSTNLESAVWQAFGGTCDELYGAVLTGPDTVIYKWADGEQVPFEGHAPVLPEGEQHVKVVCGSGKTGTLTSKGRVVVWGHIFYGDSSIKNAIPLSNGERYVDLSMGPSHCAALTSLGRVVGWGTEDFVHPEKCPVPDPPAGGRYEKVFAGHNFTAAITDSGRIVAWSSKFVTEHEIGGLLLQAPEPPAGEKFISLSAGAGHVLGLTTNGRILAWGQNSHGQLDVPALMTDESFVSVSSATAMNAATTSKGRILVWGASDEEQRTVPSLTDGELFVPPASGSEEAKGVVCNLEACNVL